VAEARAAQNREELRVIAEAAADAQAPRAVLDEIASFEDSLPEEDVDWNKAASENDGEVH
jgi:hypothetical protein